MKSIVLIQPAAEGDIGSTPEVSNYTNMVALCEVLACTPGELLDIEDLDIGQVQL